MLCPFTGLPGHSALNGLSVVTIAEATMDLGVDLITDGRNRAVREDELATVRMGAAETLRVCLTTIFNGRQIE